MKSTLIAAALAAVPFLANAECPNACSGHGNCGAFDQCTCQNGHKGNDCSQRVCPYGTAWVTTPMGDINYDGDRYDAATYDGVSDFKSREHVLLDSALGGVWETWPGDAKTKEGHFDMECSNAGLCDVTSGLCTCFDGFEGSACQRATCPGGNNCNGHGTCMNINQALSDAGSAYTYDLWDANMIRACVCDSGYAGNDCLSRVCPYGDDPLTTAHQIDETQIVEIRSEVASPSVGDNLFGTFTLSFTNKIGLTFETAPITVSSYDPTSTAVAVATKAALEALPNGVVSSVDVTAGFCDTIVAKSLAVSAGALATGSSNGGTAPVSGYYRVPTMSNCGNAVYLVDGNEFSKNGETCASIAAGDYAGVTALANPLCIRLKIKFTGSENPGDLASLTVDHSKVTYGASSGAALTNAASNDASKVRSSVSDSYTINSGGEHGFVKGNVAASKVASADGAGKVIGATITWGAGVSPALVIPTGAEVKLFCQPASGGAIYNMGKHTMSATCTVGTDATCTLAAALSDPADRCEDGSGGVIAGKVEVQLITDYISTDVDYSSAGLATEEAGFTFNGNAYKSTVSSVVPYATDVGYMLLTESPEGITAADAQAAYALTVNMAGTKESDPCANRGLCDESLGLCNCFKGFSGANCDTQNALFIGED